MMSKLRHVDLCSGIGGFSLGFSWAELSKTIMFCDTEEWCRKILAKNFNNVPIAKDVKELANDPERLVPDHDILTCGYPCQPFSVAGLRKGEEDDRHIWPFLFKIIACKRPSWVVCENVYGHVALGLDKVLLDLESQSYATRTFIVPACAKNAHHRRDRLWIICKNVGDSTSGRGGKFRVSGEEIGNAESEEAQSIRPSSTRYETMAYSKCLGWEQRSEEQGEFDREESSDQLDFGSEGRTRSRSGSHVAYTNCEPEWGGGVSEHFENERGERTNTRTESLQSRNRQARSSNSEQSSKDVADTKSEGLQGWSINSTISNGGEKESQLGNESGRVYTDEGIWFAEPNVGRVAHGISKRMDRLKGLGNAIVPQLAMQIGLAIKKEIESE